MNQNFLGQPTREDTQTLDQLRRQLMPMIGLLDKLQNDMVFKLNRGETVDWPHIRHTISIINSYLTSINAYINGSYRHTQEAVKDTAGNAILDEEKNPRMIYRDYANPGHAEGIGALHPYPQSPFPMLNERLAGMAQVLLDKRLGPTEEKWVEERLKKAAEFAYVPSEWGIEARKPIADKNEGGENNEDDDMKGWDVGIPTKRVKGTLNEDEIIEMWGTGHRTAFDKQFGKDRRFADNGEGEDEDEDEDEMEDDMEDEEDFEDVDTPKVAPTASVVMIQRAPLAVHKPGMGAPVASLGFVQRFMTSTEAQGPVGQR
ncbi:hypothetical protein GQ44DRAFT_612641 [Phaeosphaeriaceae sp. PMI808]|nr:hypothetical protein GQ44DRAFT_612641 [Phaeosphaeriaceae sp. PMI808]